MFLKFSQRCAFRASLIGHCIFQALPMNSSMSFSVHHFLLVMIFMLECIFYLCLFLFCFLFQFFPHLVIVCSALILSSCVWSLTPAGTSPCTSCPVWLSKCSLSVCHHCLAQCLSASCVSCFPCSSSCSPCGFTAPLVSSWIVPLFFYYFPFVLDCLLLQSLNFCTML